MTSTINVSSLAVSTDFLNLIKEIYIMKKQLIAVGLAGLLTIPTVSFGAEMAGPSLYGSFRAGLTFGSGDASVNDFGSRWGFKGSYEVSEGLTASYKYESKFNTTNAESSGGAGHKHAAVDAIADVDEQLEVIYWGRG